MVRFHGTKKKTSGGDGVARLPVHRLLHAGRTFGVEQLLEAHATCNKMPISLSTLCLVTLVLCNVPDSLEHEIPRRSFLSRRAIDGTRGRKYFDPEEEGAFDSYGSAGGQYDPYEEKTDLSDIRRNVPGEPGADYPAYTTLPQTGFTCEGRSRGYYADEVAGCQVFHVCHDVLVSSFLCPIGSIFSQKLLTCDWWTKVDCSSSGKYIDVNRNSYQQDDDEMIRNAYAMISLQSGTDVTKDGLVDPDRTGSVIDYQRSPGRTLDYSPVDPTGNDLRSNFEDYSNPVSRNFLPPYQPKDRNLETSRSYQERFYPAEKSRSPYEDSPIIRVQNIKDPEYRDPARNRDFQDTYRRPNEFANRFQPSYAPTVPTVTTTTRRFYSPTVPTTFRPSTLAYNKLDQLIDSSDYFFSRSRTNGFVTPPTRSVESDKDRQNLRATEKPEVPSGKLNYGHQDSYEDDYEDVDTEDRRHAPPVERFQVRVADNFRLNRTGLLLDQIYRGFSRAGDDEEILDDFETRGSIGLGHALGQSFRGISVQQQNPANDGLKDEEAHHRHTLSRPESTTSFDDQKEETTEQYQRNDQRDREAIPKHQDVGKEDFVPSTTPSVIETTIKATTNLHELNSSNEGSLKVSIDKVDKFLRPPEEPRSKFRINVPDLAEVSTLLIRYTTLDDGPYSGTTTTESPRYQNTYSDDYGDHPTEHEDVGATSNYGDVERPRDSGFQNYPSTEGKPLVSNAGSGLLSSSGSLGAEVPFRDVSSTVVSYNESSSDFGAPERGLPPSQYTSDSILASNDTQKKTEGNFNDGLQDAVENFDSKTTCSSLDGNCEKIRTSVPIDSSGTPTSSKSATDVNRFAETATPGLNKESRTSPATKSRVTESSGSTSKPVTHRSAEESRKNSKEDEETSTALIKSIRPETLKQIEENIEKNNSPYRVTLTVNKNEEFVPTAGDLIGKLIAQQDKESSTISDKLHELEVIKSMEPEIHMTDPQTVITNNRRSNVRNNLSEAEGNNSRTENFNTISLLQLMSELLKLDRAPRPFSLSDVHNSDRRTQPEVISGSLASTTIAKEANLNRQPQEEVKSKFQESSTESVVGASVPRSKDRILDQLTENFGEPLSRTDNRHLDLAQKDGSVDSQEDSPPEDTDKHQESFGFRTTGGTGAPSSSGSSTKAGAVITTTSVPQTTFTTDSGKTVVKTEFVPSIGFSLDTDEGREEYAEAVLGGLIEPEVAESEKKETVQESKKNETSKDA